MNFRLLPIAQAQLDGIWLYVATESGSVEIANREVPKSQIAFGFSQGIQKLAVGATMTYSRKCAVSPSANISSFTPSKTSARSSSAWREAAGI